MSIVKVLKDGRAVNWKSALCGKDNEIRVFTSPGLRIEQTRKFYTLFRRMYPRISEEAVDAAFEAYILGFVLACDVVTFARNYDEVVNSEGSVFIDAPSHLRELTGDIF